MADKKKAPAGSSFWQIIFPTLVGTLLLLLVGIMIVLYTSTGNVSRFAEISTVLLVIPVLFSSFLVMLLLGALIVLIYKIIQGLPSITGWILDKVERIQKVVQAVSKNAAVPVIRPAAFLAGFRCIFTKNKSRGQID
jgi:predicted membrane protein